MHINKIRFMRSKKTFYIRMIIDNNKIQNYV